MPPENDHVTKNDIRAKIQDGYKAAILDLIEVPFLRHGFLSN